MPRWTFHSLIPLLALLSLAGCGGSGGSNAVPAATSVRFTPGENFNGPTSTITLNAATATVGDGYTDATLTIEDERTLRIAVPTDAPAVGKSFTVGGENGAIVEYSNDDLGLQVWNGTAGKVTIVAASSTRLTFRLDRVRIDADSEWGGTGTATLDGYLADVVRFAPGGSFSLVAATEGETSADLSPFADESTVDYTTVSGSSMLTLRDPDPTIKRSLSVSVPDSIPVGSSVDATETMTYWTEGVFDLISTGELFRAVSGTVRVVRRSREAFAVELTNVRFEPYNLPSQNLATGAFVVDGTLAKP
ncbi:MAG: hypothetical protein ACO1SV_24290 [Fimbriimonas sp.]